MLEHVAQPARLVAAPEEIVAVPYGRTRLIVQKAVGSAHVSEAPEAFLILP
jgi:hypothetical protein